MELEVQIPEWLTVQFLNQCLQSKEKYEKYNVSSFTAEPAVAPGNNFGSSLLRVKVHYKEEFKDEGNSLSLIVKSPLTTGHLFFDDFYSSEPKFYKYFLREAYKLIRFVFAPDSFVSPISSVVVLEDLKVQGYTMADRANQLDFEHCRLYMIAAAHFHAMSFAIHKQNPNLVRSMSKEKMFSNDLKSAKSTDMLMRYAVEYLVDCLATIQIDENWCKMLKDCSSTLWDMLVKAHKPNGVFNCINQGDPWTANMMFCYDSGGNPSEIKILDFQNLRYSTPVCDLIFFIWTSAKHEVRENRLQELYEIYLNTLNSSLTEFHCSENLSKEIFQEHLEALSPVAIWCVASNLPIMLNPSPKDLDLLYSALKDDYSHLKNPFKHYYFQGYIETHLPRLVQQLHTTGVFDYLKNNLK